MAIKLISDSPCNTVQVWVESVTHTHTLSYQKEHLTFLEKFLSGDLTQFPIVKSLLLILRAWESMRPHARICMHPHVSMHGLQMVRWGLQAYLLGKMDFRGCRWSRGGDAGCQGDSKGGEKKWMEGSEKGDMCLSVKGCSEEKSQDCLFTCLHSLSLPFTLPSFPPLSLFHSFPSLFLSLPHSQLLSFKTVHPNKAKTDKEARTDERITFPRARCWRH